jgi:hypothetical protein
MPVRNVEITARITIERENKLIQYDAGDKYATRTVENLGGLVMGRFEAADQRQHCWL